MHVNGIAEQSLVLTDFTPAVGWEGLEARTFEGSTCTQLPICRLLHRVKDRQKHINVGERKKTGLEQDPLRGTSVGME